VALVAGWALSASADDAKGEATVTGTWKASFKRPDGQTIEATYKLKQDGNKLTGTAMGGTAKEVEIENGMVKDGEVSFQVTRERDGQKTVLHYKGKLDGDTITGKTEFERDGETRSFDWVAKRQKEAK
jgi:hypothetical protein